MAAQTKDTSRPWRDGEIVEAVGVQAAKAVYAGGILEIDATGHVKPATKAADKTYFGAAMTGADNSRGAAGAATVRVRRRATVLLEKSGTAVRGKAAYVVDDQTVTDVKTGASKVGQIVGDDDDGVWVDMAAVGV